MWAIVQFTLNCCTNWIMGKLNRWFTGVLKTSLILSLWFCVQITEVRLWQLTPKPTPTNPRKHLLKSKLWQLAPVCPAAVYRNHMCLCGENMNVCELVLCCVVLLNRTQAGNTIWWQHAISAKLLKTSSVSPQTHKPTIRRGSAHIPQHREYYNTVC